MFIPNSYFKTSEGTVTVALPVTITTSDGVKCQAILVNNDDAAASISIYFDDNTTNTRTIKAGEYFSMVVRFKTVYITTTSVAAVSYRCAIGGE